MIAAKMCALCDKPWHEPLTCIENHRDDLIRHWPIGGDVRSPAKDTKRDGNDQRREHDDHKGGTR